MRFRRPMSALCAVIFAFSATMVTASVDSARSLFASGQLNEALAALEADPTGDAEARFLRGVVLAELNRSEEAESMFRELIREYPDYPEPYNNLAVLLAEAGRFDEAVETLKSALRTHPSYRTAWDNLTTIYGRLASEAYSRALNVESSQQTSVELALLGTMAGAPSRAMAPVEAIQAVAVAPMTEIADAGVSDQVPAEALREEPVEVLQAESSDGVDSEEVAAAPAPAEPIEDPQEEESQSELAGAETVEIEEIEADQEESEEEVTAGPAVTELKAVVEAWAAAWSEQRVDDYLSYYSSSFVPEDGSTLLDWKALRRSRLEAPEYIRVAVALIDVTVDDDAGAVIFNQSYESNTFSDVVTKTLAFVHEGGGPKIVRETVSP